MKSCFPPFAADITASICSYLNLQSLAKAHLALGRLGHEACVVSETTGACNESGLSPVKLSLREMRQLHFWVAQTPGYSEAPMAEVPGGRGLRFMARELSGPLAMAMTRRKVSLSKHKLRFHSAEVGLLATQTLANMSWLTCRHSRKVLERIPHGDFMHIRDRYEAVMSYCYGLATEQITLTPHRRLHLLVDQEEEGCEDYHQSSIEVHLTMHDDLSYEGTHKLLHFRCSRGDMHLNTLETDGTRAWEELAHDVFKDRREIIALGVFLVDCLCSPAVHWRAEGGGHGSRWFGRSGNQDRSNLLTFELDHIFGQASAQALKKLLLNDSRFLSEPQQDQEEDAHWQDEEEEEDESDQEDELCWGSPEP